MALYYLHWLILEYLASWEETMIKISINDSEVICKQQAHTISQGKDLTRSMSFWAWLILRFFSLRKDYLGLMTFRVHKTVKCWISDQDLQSSDGKIEPNMQKILNKGVQNYSSSFSTWNWCEFTPQGRKLKAKVVKKIQKKDFVAKSITINWLNYYRKSNR